MKPTSPSDDNLDQLFGAFFKAQVPRTWPAAPATNSVNEPASLVAERAEAAESPHHQPSAANRDPGRKSRYTLAASVAILLGTCWTLSNGLQSGTRPANGNSNGTNAQDVLGPSNATLPFNLTEPPQPPVPPANDKNDMLGKSN